VLTNMITASKLLFNAGILLLIIILATVNLTAMRQRKYKEGQTNQSIFAPAGQRTIRPRL
jgi:hypothetical protein